MHKPNFFQTSKNIISYSIINDLSHNIKTIVPKEFEKDFNEFLWFNRKKLNLFNCKIVEKIEISSLMEMKENDGKIIKMQFIIVIIFLIQY